MKDPTLVVFCKRPKIGQGKQRLAAEIGKDKAFEIAKFLLACAFEDARNWKGPVILSPSDKDDIDWFRQYYGKKCTLLSQPLGNIGERIQWVDQELRNKGHNSLIYIGTDAPGLNSAYYQKACKALRLAEVVLGPAEDGGVTIMGSNSIWPALKKLPWSMDNLGISLLEHCLENGKTVEVLPQSSDVDLKSDLLKVKDYLVGDKRKERRRMLEWINSELG